MKLFKKLWPFFFIFCVWFVLFKPFFVKGLLPMPADIITGVYYPWLDYKWGFSVGVPVKNPMLSDVPSLLYPWRMLAINQLKVGYWPLWNPYYFAGMPLLANFQSAVFSYVNLFFLFLPKAWAWSAGVAISPFLTMLALFAFLRRRSLAVLPSLFGSVAFALSGFQIAWLEYNVHGHTVLFFVLILLVLDRFLSSNKTGWLFLLSPLLALQIFSGYLPLAIYGGIICSLYVIFFYFWQDIRKPVFPWKKYLLILFFGILGLAISAVQLLPGFELARLSIRLADPSVEGTRASNLPLVNLVTLLAPDLFGNPGTHNYFGVGFYDNFYFFIGTGTIILAILALTLAKKNRQIIFWAGCLLLSLILVFDNFLGKFLQKIFFLSGGVAARALFITDFSLAILAAYGLQEILTKDINLKKVNKICLSLLGVLILAGLGTLLVKNHPNRLVAQKNLIIPFGFLFLSALAIMAMVIKKRSFFFRRVFALILLFLVTVQLLYSARKYLPFSKKELLFPTTPVLDFLLSQKEKDKEPFRVEIGDVIPQNFLMPYGLETASGYDALLPQRMGEYMAILRTSDLQKNIARVQFVNNRESSLFPLFNMKYVLAKKSDEISRFTATGKLSSYFDNPRFKQVFEDKTVVVLEDKAVFPRAFFVGQYQVAQTERDFLTLARQNFDFSRAVVLEENPQKPQLPVKGKVFWQEYEPGRLKLQTEADSSGFLFLGNNDFLGWVAKIDGKPTKIWRANFTFQSFWVEKGSHVITLEYSPKSFYYGFRLTILALGIWFLLLTVKLTSILRRHV